MVCDAFGTSDAVSVFIAPSQCRCTSNDDNDVLGLFPGLLLASLSMRASGFDDGRFASGGDFLTKAATLKRQPGDETEEGLKLQVGSVDRSSLGSYQAVIFGDFGTVFDCECEVCEDGLTFKVDCSQVTFPVDSLYAGLPGPKLGECVNFAFRGDE